MQFQDPIQELIQQEKKHHFRLAIQFHGLGMMVDHHTLQRPLLVDQTKEHRYSGLHHPPMARLIQREHHYGIEPYRTYLILPKRFRWSIVGCV